MKKPDIGPFIPYYGAKWRSSGHYPAPLHNTVIEPFAGGGGYSLRHLRPSRLYDLSHHVLRAWRYLLRATPEEILSLPAPVSSVDDVPEVARALVGFWLNPGSAQPKRTPSNRADPFLPLYRAGSVWSEKTRARLATQAPRVQGLFTFEQRDYRAIDIPAEPATFFVDPPYRRKGVHYVTRWADADYVELAAWCRAVAAKGHQVIVCENAGEDWLPFVPLHTYHGSVAESAEAICVL